MPIVLDKDTATGEPTVLIFEDGFVHFRGTEAKLIQLIIDTHSMAAAIGLDLDVDEGISDNNVFDYEQYKEFSQKY